ncbi:MAG: AMP-binding protein, partial [Actinomycetota bacterium]|nr:AMP-binding protein [Actinomycetota bacterium]
MSSLRPSTRLRPGDRVALLVPATAAYVETALALLAQGVVPIPLDPRLTEHERRRILDGLDPTLVVTDDGHLADLLA